MSLYIFVSSNTVAVEALKKWDGGRAPTEEEVYGEGACYFPVKESGSFTPENL